MCQTVAHQPPGRHTDGQGDISIVCRNWVGVPGKVLMKVALVIGGPVLDACAWPLVIGGHTLLVHLFG